MENEQWKIDKISKRYLLSLQTQPAFQLSIFNCQLILSYNVLLKINVIRLVQFFFC